MTSNQIEPAVLEELRQLDSCSVANAIETFGVRLRNTGFADSTVRCIFEDFPPLVGYAATVRIRTADPPMEGDSYYYRLDWLEHVVECPASPSPCRGRLGSPSRPRFLHRRRPRQYLACPRIALAW